jgi:hypothetical protein
VAPAAKGAWLLRIDNESDEPIRIPADVRLLRFEVRALDDRGRWPRRATVCDGPQAFGLSTNFPYQRELVLEPGQSFVEQFDPRLICFGKKAKLLAGGSLIKPTFGWKPRPKWSRRKEQPPFAADTAKRPRRYSPRKRLEAPTMLLSYAEPEFSADPAAESDAGATSAVAAPSEAAPVSSGGPSREPKPPADGASSASASAGSAGEPAAGQDDARGSPGVGDSPDSKLRVPDELAAQLSLGTSQYADARHPRDIAVSLKTQNVGERSRRVALRRRQLSFTITGPDGVKQCPRRSVQHVIPPDLFRKLSAGNDVRMTVRLAELCPWDTFRRPGVYVATPTLHATETARDKTAGALTATVSSKDGKGQAPAEDPTENATLIRVRRGMEPYYKRPPVMVPTRFFKIGEEAYLKEQQEQGEADEQEDE